LLQLKSRSSLEPLDDNCRILQSDCKCGYHGGVNGSYKIGYFDNIVTYDYDLKNAYPVSMCEVPDVDWSNCVLYEFERDHTLCLDDFKNETGEIDVFAPIVGYVSFEFPESVQFPCFAIEDDGNLVFPRTSAGLNGVYVLGPDLYCALMWGAKIIVHRGYKIRTLKRDDGTTSYSLRVCTKQLVSDRIRAQEIFGKHSIVEQTLKLMVNGCYGKTAQNVVEKRHWSAITDEIESIGSSIISNPFVAAMTTSIIRSALLYTMNEVHSAGYSIYSCTTDGFISDIPYDFLSNLAIGGIRDRLSKVREYLTDNKANDIWEIKHIQNDLVNFNTRGNVSLNTASSNFISNDIEMYESLKQYKNLHGVCAHGNAKSPFENDSYEDRLWLVTNVFSRTEATPCVFEERTTFKEYLNGDDMKIKYVERDIRLDFDMKRKPIKDSFKTVFREN